MTLHYVDYKEGLHYVTRCLNVEVSSFGDSSAAAVAALKEALELYFEDGQGDEFITIEDAALGEMVLNT